MVIISSQTNCGLGKRAAVALAVTRIAPEEKVVRCLNVSWSILARSISRSLRSATEPPTPPRLPLYWGGALLRLRVRLRGFWGSLGGYELRRYPLQGCRK